MIRLEPIGWVRASRVDAVDDDWDSVHSAVELDGSQFGPQSLLGLEAFSHVDVVFSFHLVDEHQIERRARHPRGNPEWPEVGIFAQRAKMRPNRIGVTTCRLRGVDGLTVQLDGLDAVDGTPVLDLKPYMVEFGPRGEIRQPAWSHELMAGYWHAARGATPAP